MKNIYLLIFILIFLYFICNRCIEKFSVGCQDNGQDNGQGNDNKINISSGLTLKDGCKKNYCQLNSDTPGYTYWKKPDTCTCPENTRLQSSSGNTRCKVKPSKICNDNGMYINNKCICEPDYTGDKCDICIFNKFIKNGTCECPNLERRSICGHKIFCNRPLPYCGESIDVSILDLNPSKYKSITYMRDFTKGDIEYKADCDRKLIHYYWLLEYEKKKVQGLPDGPKPNVKTKTITDETPPVEEIIDTNINILNALHCLRERFHITYIKIEKKYPKCKRIYPIPIVPVSIYYKYMITIKASRKITLYFMDETNNTYSLYIRDTSILHDVCFNSDNPKIKKISI